MDALERRDKVGIEAGIIIIIYNVGLAQEGLYKTAETISDSTASYYIDGQWLQWYMEETWWWGSLVNILFFME